MCIEVSNGKEDPRVGVGRSNHQVTQSSCPTKGGTPNHVGSHSENTNLLLLRLASRKVWSIEFGELRQACCTYFMCDVKWLALQHELSSGADSTLVIPLMLFSSRSLLNLSYAATQLCVRLQDSQERQLP